MVVKGKREGENEKESHGLRLLFLERLEDGSLLLLLAEAVVVCRGVRVRRVLFVEPAAGASRKAALQRGHEDVSGLFAALH